jgi:hypothetical protein
MDLNIPTLMDTTWKALFDPKRGLTSSELFHIRDELIDSVMKIYIQRLVQIKFPEELNGHELDVCWHLTCPYLHYFFSALTNCDKLIGNRIQVYGKIMQAQYEFVDGKCRIIPTYYPGSYSLLIFDTTIGNGTVFYTFRLSRSRGLAFEKCPDVTRRLCWIIPGCLNFQEQIIEYNVSISENPFLLSHQFNKLVLRLCDIEFQNRCVKYNIPLITKSLDYVMILNLNENSLHLLEHDPDVILYYYLNKMNTGNCFNTCIIPTGSMMKILVDKPRDLRQRLELFVSTQNFYPSEVNVFDSTLIKKWIRYLTEVEKKHNILE